MNPLSSNNDKNFVDDAGTQLFVLNEAEIATAKDTGS
jgi:hypothetical protein